jgi:hypothetical protein
MQGQRVCCVVSIFGEFSYKYVNFIFLIKKADPPSLKNMCFYYYNITKFLQIQRSAKTILAMLACYSGTLDSRLMIDVLKSYNKVIKLCLAIY